MKNILKKLKENWLDYLVILISFLAVLFVYTFTAFYQPKESEKTINKENIVKVLRDKKKAQEGTFQSKQTAFYIGNMSRYNSNNTFIEFYLNIEYVGLSFDNSLNVDNIELELMYYITASTKYLNGVGMETTATFNPTSSVDEYYYFTNQSINSIEEIENIKMSFNMNSLRYEGGYEEEDVYFDFEINYDIGFTLNNIQDPEHDIFIEDNYNSFGIDASNLPVSVRQEINNNIFYDINDVRANTSVRDFQIYFNTDYAGYNNGYDSGWDKGYESGYNYGLEIGYNNGYNEGVIVGSNNFNILNLIRSLFDLLWDVLSVEMLPNIKLIYIVAIPLVLSVIKFILGWFR